MDVGCLSLAWVRTVGPFCVTCFIVTLRWVRCFGTPRRYMRLVLSGVLKGLTGTKPGLTLVLFCTRSHLPMSLSSLELTIEQVPSNCATLAWELSFSAGFAWWMTFLRSNLVIAVRFGSCWVTTLFWANVLSCMLWIFLVLNFLKVVWSSQRLMLRAEMASSWVSERFLKAKIWCFSLKDGEVSKLPFCHFSVVVIVSCT